MRFATKVLIVVLSVVLSRGAAEASGGSAEFYTFDDFPGGLDLVVPHSISADGTTVVGDSHSEFGSEAFVWTRATGMQRMPATALGRPYTAWDVSADGSVIVGELAVPTGHRRPYRWNRESGYELIMPELADFDVHAYSLSDDGRVIAGDAHSASQNYQAFIWTDESGVRFLGDLPGGRFYSEVRDLSADGSTVVGVSASDIGEEAFRWTLQDGMQALGSLHGNDSLYQSSARAVSANGSVVVGNSASIGFTSVQAVMWDAANGLNGIGERLPGTSYWSEAHDTTADGSIIVGQHYAVSDDGAFVWDAKRGLRSLADDLILRFGLGEEIGEFRLASAQAVSADGRVFTGFGDDGANAWVAIVPEPPTFVLGALAILLGATAVRKRSREVPGAAT